MGRSGTTMLTNMLNLNPNIIACPENEFILFTKSSFENKNFENIETVDSFVNLFNYKFSKVISFWKPKSDLKQSILNLNDKTFSNACKQVYLNYPFAYSETKNVKYIVDKNPIYSLYIDDLCKLFPDSKYIVISRDYRDNILSRKKFSDKKSSIYSLALSWNYFYDCIFKSISKNNLKYTILRYEDLVEKPTETLTELCEFLEVEFDDKMLHFQDLSTKIKGYIKQNLTDEDYGKLIAMHHNLEKKINNDKVDSYKKELSESEISILDATCNKYAQKFKYNASSNLKLSFSSKIKIMVSYSKIRIYYYLHSISNKIPLKLKFLFADKKI